MGNGVDSTGAATGFCSFIGLGSVTFDIPRWRRVCPYRKFNREPGQTYEHLFKRRFRDFPPSPKLCQTSNIQLRLASRAGIQPSTNYSSSYCHGRTKVHAEISRTFHFLAKRQRTGALQDASRISGIIGVARSVLDCGGPPPLFPEAYQTVPMLSGTAIHQCARRVIMA